MPKLTPVEETGTDLRAQFVGGAIAARSAGNPDQFQSPGGRPQGQVVEESTHRLFCFTNTNLHQVVDDIPVSLRAAFILKLFQGCRADDHPGQGICKSAGQVFLALESSTQSSHGSISAQCKGT